MLRTMAAWAGQTPLHKALNVQPEGIVAAILVPRVPQQHTAELLLKLGATPVSSPVAAVTAQ